MKAAAPWRAAGALPLLLLLAGCGNMADQPNVRPYEASRHFPGDASALPPPAHVVAHAPGADEVLLTGRRGGALVADVPVPVTRALLERGRERFNINCAVCHGEDGYGRGIIVRRGFPPPPSLHEERLRTAPAGHIFEVITHGYGLMYPADDRVAPADRWAIAAYIRALQLSQHATVADLTPSERTALGVP